jgi:glutamate/tyrosine decarboxylase-like PLP-dependent enzyme
MAFVHPEIAWDFRLAQVRSINVSNHKYGLVYPGMGCVIFRDASCVAEELIFKIPLAQQRQLLTTPKSQKKFSMVLWVVTI